MRCFFMTGAVYIIEKIKSWIRWGSEGSVFVHLALQPGGERGDAYSGKIGFAGFRLL